MRTLSRLSGVCARLLSFAVLFGASEQVFAQSAAISGRVTNPDGAPIVGASVVITSLNLGTTSGTNGAYQIAIPAGQATGQRVTLTARFIGFTPSSRQITLSAEPQTQNFELKSDPFRLEAMVVTGVAEATSAKKLAFSVAHVGEEQMKQVPGSSPISALAGKVAGARIALGTGNPGAAPAIRLRGSTSLMRSNPNMNGATGNDNDPLIIVDGVITKNTLADFDANDIESVEVLKGAAASSFYGSDAANGVVSITTKRGKNLGNDNVSFSTRGEYGQSGLTRWVPLNQHHRYLLKADGSFDLTAQGGRKPDPSPIADNPYPSTGPDRWRNQLKEWLGDGTFYSTNYQLGMRRGNTNFNSSYTYDRNEGIMPFRSGQFRQNMRVNIDQQLGSKADVSGSFTYGINKNDYNPNDSQGWFSLLQAPGDLDLRNPNGNDTIPYFTLLPASKVPSARPNPLYALANQQYQLRRERILGSFVARYRPFDWLRMEASYGTDRANVREKTYEFRGYLNDGGLPGTGRLDFETDNNLSTNTQVSATSNKLFFGNLLSTTRVQFLAEELENSQLDAQGTKFNLTDVPDLASLDPTSNEINSALITERTMNYMVSQSFDFKDRYIIDGLYRRDGSSLFGPNSRWQNFYRVALAYRLSEDLKLPGIQEFKLRAARGTAGLRPNYADQYETYTVDNGVATKQQLGNLDLKPAIQTETEYGINVQFLDRFDLELVRADRKTVGAFLEVPLSLAQSGGFVNQIRNAADVEAKTYELSLNTRVFDTPDFSYNFTLTGDNTTQRITKMNSAPFRRGAGGQGQDVFYYKAGEKLGIMYGTRWVRSIAELHDNPANTNINDADYVVNSDGYVVLKSRLNTTLEAPIAYINKTGDVVNTQHVIGDVNPDFSFGFANNVRYKSFSFYALFDGVQGGDLYNFTKQWMFQDERHGSQDQSGRPEAERRPLAFYSAGLYNGLVANDYFIEDGSYVKLRELSVAYNLSGRMLDRFGLGRYAKGMKIALIGRNLFTWTNYTGFDPEATSGGDFNFRIDGFRYPNFRTITGQLEFTF